MSGDQVNKRLEESYSVAECLFSIRFQVTRLKVLRGNMLSRRVIVCVLMLRPGK